MVELVGKYNVGDFIRLKERSKKRGLIKCPTCKGFCHLKTLKDEEIECPTCDATGEIWSNTIDDDEKEFYAEVDRVFLERNKLSDGSIVQRNSYRVIITEEIENLLNKNKGCIKSLYDEEDIFGKISIF